MKEQEYFSTSELSKGIAGFPPIDKVTLQNLRAQRKIKYVKLWGKCYYKIEWIQEYIDKNTVDTLI